MLRNMGKNLERLDFPQLERVKERHAADRPADGPGARDRLQVDQLDERFRTMFPGAVGGRSGPTGGSPRRAPGSTARWTASGTA
jgi:hypothetical protein